MMKLSEYIEENGLIKKFFAKKIGITEVTLRCWLSGKSLPNVKHALEIEKFTKGKIRCSDWINE